MSHADDVLDNQYYIGMGASIFGITAEGKYRYNEWIGASALAGFYEGSMGANGGTSNIDLTLGGAAITADLYPLHALPFVNGIHLSTGLAYNGLEASTSETMASATVNNTVYNNVQIESKLTPTMRINPMAAIGWDKTLFNKIRLSTSSGLMYTGGADLDISDSTGQINKSEFDRDPSISKFSDQMDKFNLMPFAKITLGVNF